MRVLVTGATGFTGNYVKSELEYHDHEVIDLRSNLLQPEALAHEIEQVQPDAVIHLAAIAFVSHGKANDFYQVNLIGTRNLLAAIHQSAPNIQSILLVSSANIYGNQAAGFLNEEDKAHPANDYALSKLAMEHLAHLWMPQLPVFIVRPFNYTGVGQNNKFLIPRIISHFQRKLPVIELGNIHVRREFNDVRMVADIYQRLLVINPIGQTFNVCSGYVYTIREIMTLCENISDHSINIQVNQNLVRKSEVKTLAGDNSKLKALLGQWQSYPLEETLTWMLANNMETS